LVIQRYFYRRAAQSADKQTYTPVDKRAFGEEMTLAFKLASRAAMLGCRGVIAVAGAGRIQGV
jgi:hypothetical protein